MTHCRTSWECPFRSFPQMVRRGTARLADGRPCQVGGLSCVCAWGHPGDAKRRARRSADRAGHRQRQIRERGRPRESDQRRRCDRRPFDQSRVRLGRSPPRFGRRRIQAGGSRICRSSRQRRRRGRLLFRTRVGNRRRKLPHSGRRETDERARHGRRGGVAGPDSHRGGPRQKAEPDHSGRLPGESVSSRGGRCARDSRRLDGARRGRPDRRRHADRFRGQGRLRLL